MPDDERVEDAALTDQDILPKGRTKSAVPAPSRQQGRRVLGSRNLRKTEEVTAEIVKGPSVTDKKIIVGRDILELLSSSMYINPLVIFREYVQNATDAIDDAVKFGLLASIETGRVDIRVDHIERRVVIRDNGTGVSNSEFPTRMLSFGASAKRGTDARGFRGVGRLAGLGYVQALVFRSRSAGDPCVMEATWDIHAVKRMLASSHSGTDLRKVVSEAVNLMIADGAGHPAHFFEVELIKPRRIGNDKLLNEVEIASYVGQVCPCPLSPTFSHRTEIEKILAPHGRSARCYNIHINGTAEPVYRPYHDKISYSDKKTGRINNKLTPLKVRSADGDGLAAVGWFLHHDYQGAIPISEGVRGLRARVGNLQIGNERIFAEVFPEDRFCSWSIGEVHVLDTRVIPNGRRDAFETNIYLDNLISHLRLFGSEIARECRLASRRRHRRRTIKTGIDKVHQKLEVIRQGAVSPQFVTTMEDEIRDLVREIKAAADFELFNDGERRLLKNQIKSLNIAVEDCVKCSDDNNFSRLTKQKKEAYNEVFDLVYRCSVNKIAAKSLVDRMLACLSRS